MNKEAHISLTTGRPIHEIKKLAEKLNVLSYIGYNGAAAFINGSSCFEKPIYQNSVEKVLMIASEHRHELAIQLVRLTILFI
ncbi:MAG: HAD hydrolase family protein [Bacillus sp. (in: Bacteria)]|nr:HAD hydrolase family protein [Bacillus sp. (in: firmicutes)]